MELYTASAMRRQRLQHGLYAITGGLRSTQGILLAVGAAIKGGAILIQYRDKVTPFAHRKGRAAALCQLCRHLNVPLIINDDPNLARDVGADGVHLGQDDPSYE